VRDNQFVIFVNGRQVFGRHPNIFALVFSIECLPALQKGVSTQRHYYPHWTVTLSPPFSRITGYPMSLPTKP
jgi:hypothetical protein